MPKVFTYLNDEAGFSASEFALGLAVVGGVTVVAGHFLGGLLTGSAGVVSGVADCIRFHSHITACLVKDRRRKAGARTRQEAPDRR